MCMERRQFLAALGASAAAWGVSWPARVLAQGGADAAFATMLDRLFFDNLLIDPRNATSLGLDRGVRAALRSRLGDNSPAGRAMKKDFDRRALAEVRGVDPVTLGDAGRRNRDVVAYMLEQRLAGVPFGIEQVQQPYPITQQQGSYFEIPDFLDSQHPVETADDAEAYLARLHAFGFALDDDTADQKDKAARGIAAPGWSLDLALGQIRQMRAPAPETNSMVQSLVRRATAKGIAGDWQSRAARIVGSEIYPALDRQAALLTRVRRTTRGGDGAWRMP